MLRCDTYGADIRWRPGERLHHLFELRCDRLAADGKSGHLAVDTGDQRVTFAQLDARANGIAHHLHRLGFGPGMRIGLLVDKSVDGYVALLAIMKIDAAYVPLDQSFPVDRISYIAGDAGISALVTVASLKPKLDGFDACPVIAVDELAAVAPATPERLALPSQVLRADALAYIVYTSGSTGNPKGVAVDHSSICNFVRVAADVYGYTPDDRVYQGMTLAFDFSVEELWVPLVAGATLVPGRSDVTLVGRDLANFLIAREVTGLACVPTLLATITTDLPALRFLLVSGEACPHDLVVRWHRPGRRMLNAYGPTEATVTASWTELHPDKPVTIGVPLPTYTMMILAEDARSVVPDGEIGEIGIAGIGLARGYVNRDDLTAQAFVPDFLDIADNPSKRIYRTGDLGRINASGEIEYHGRIDTQVKIRGYRIELTEIESKLLEFPGVAQAVVRTYAPAGTPTALAAYVTGDPGARLEPQAIAAYLQTRLPGYMVPAYIEQIAEIPMLPSHKADRKRLPDPSGQRVVKSTAEFVAPRSSVEMAAARALGAALRIEDVSIEDDFFRDLGADSLTMAQFIARMHDAVPDVDWSIADAYLNPTISRLVAAKETTGPRLIQTRVEPHRASRLAHAMCGLFQYVYYVAIAFLYLLLASLSYQWQSTAPDLATLYLRAVASAALFAGVTIGLPIAAKWIIVGRFREQPIPIWSLAYYRFWVVKQLIQTNPIALFKGQPIFNWYMRMLGARIGPGAVLNTRYVPVVPDLLTVGAGSVLAKDSLIQGYRAEYGYIVFQPVTIGRDAYVGESSVIDFGAHIGDGGQLAHVSCLHSGQTIPAGGRFHGSPAVDTNGNFVPVPPRPCSTVRRYAFTTGVIALLIGVIIPGIEVGSHLAVKAIAASTSETASAAGAQGALPEFSGYVAMMLIAASLAIFIGGFLGGLLMTVVMPRLLAPFFSTGTVYPLYGFHYAVAMASAWVSNSYFYNLVFGDSSFITSYVRWVGYRLGAVKQTGSNFGSYQKHDIAEACDIGSGAMVSDQLSLVNIRQSSSSFSIERASIPADTFLGNQIVFIAGAKLGPGNLLGTKVMLPLDGPVRTNVGLLGSPCFEIPRQVVTKRSFDPFADTPEKWRRLAAKNRHNLVTLGYYLSALWLYSLLSLSLAYVTYHLHDDLGIAGLIGFAIFSPLVSIAYFLAMERLGPGQIDLKPATCTIHDEYFWRIERYWKMGETPLRLAFKGTPFRPWVYRMLGVDVGRMVFDDGCTITEKGLTKIGDYCCLNEGVSLQCHSLEDGLFKSDRISIGDDATLGPAAFVNYAVTIGAGAVVLADSFVMKGSAVAAGQTWAGNPGRQV
jgi:non-ribosomal peptide synthetase-like protein